MRTRSLRNIAGSVIFAGLSLISVSSIMAQTPNPGGDTPTGVAGGFGGSMPIGSGTFDFYEMNATRSVTDCTVPGAVIPFSYTRIWNSRSHGWTDNWQWSCKANTDLESDNFLGYTIYYPDGRVVQFNKPVKNGAPGDPGVYPPNLGVVDRFSVVASPQEGQLLTSDGSVVHFPLDGSGSVAGLYGFPMPSPVGGPGGRGIYASSIVDPHGLTVTFTYNSLGRTITEPGGRWIRIGPIQGSPTTHASAILTTSLGQSVTYTFDCHLSRAEPHDQHHKARS